jgi:hypothetical protein
MKNIDQERVAFEKWVKTTLYPSSLDVWKARAALVVEQEPVALIDGDGHITFAKGANFRIGTKFYTHPQPSADDARDITIILSRAYDEIAYLHSKIMQHAGIESDGRSNSVCVAINEFLVAMKGTK